MLDVNQPKPLEQEASEVAQALLKSLEEGDRKLARHRERAKRIRELRSR